MDTRIIVVRHAQGEGNLKGEFHGQYNSDLTDFGKKQAECTADFLSNWEIDAAYSSDIARAYSTASIIAARHGLKVTKDKGLREINAGKWEQMKFEDLGKFYPAEYEMWTHKLADCTCPDGESVRGLQQRVNGTIQSIVRANAGKSILIGTHATPIRVMGCIWHRIDIAAISELHWVPNASVTVVEYDSQTLEFKLIDYAMSDHLLKVGMLTGLPKNI